MVFGKAINQDLGLVEVTPIELRLLLKVGAFLLDSLP